MCHVDKRMLFLVPGILVIVLQILRAFMTLESHLAFDTHDPRLDNSLRTTVIIADYSFLVIAVSTDSASGFVLESCTEHDFFR